MVKTIIIFLLLGIGASDGIYRTLLLINKGQTEITLPDINERVKYREANNIIQC